MEERKLKSCHKTEKKAVTNVSNQWRGAKEQLKRKPSPEAGSEMLRFPLQLQSPCESPAVLLNVPGPFSDMAVDTD